MGKYTVRAEVTISVSTDVEADSEKEAVIEAAQRPMCTLYATNQNDPDTEWVTSGELDGTPCLFKVEAQ